MLASVIRNNSDNLWAALLSSIIALILQWISRKQGTCTSTKYHLTRFRCYHLWYNFQKSSAFSISKQPFIKQVHLTKAYVTQNWGYTRCSRKEKASVVFNNKDFYLTRKNMIYNDVISTFLHGGEIWILHRLYIEKSYHQQKLFSILSTKWETNHRQSPSKNHRSMYRITDHETPSSMVRTCSKNGRVKVPTLSLIQWAQFRERTTELISSKVQRSTQSNNESHWNWAYIVWNTNTRLYQVVMAKYD